jgi:5-methylcytosine-specific restriction protein B
VSGIYPFNDLAEFEKFRGIALQDLTTARARLRLRQSSDGRAMVRIYYGPPGTGKTLVAVQKAVELVDPSFTGDNFQDYFEHFTTGLADRTAFVTFHQALQYEDVVESIRPVLVEDDGEESLIEEDGEESSGNEATAIQYQLHAGPLMRILRDALDNEEADYVLVIDEINRGDISRILGPLISSLEPDKRLGGPYPIGFDSQYPRAGEDPRIFMPPNLHIIGTMNSADRNIALVDYALRRRFEFVEVPPDPSLLGVTKDEPAIDLELLLKTLNRRVSFLLGKDHEIGHGYLMGCETNEQAVTRFARRVLPLLSEYFYGNEGALLLVLGDKMGGEHNIHRIESAADSFEAVFGRNLDSALELGYRSQQAQLTIDVDPRFWDSSGVSPGPADPDYAARALAKVYQAPSS